MTVLANDVVSIEFFHFPCVLKYELNPRLVGVSSYKFDSYLSF